MKELFNDVYRNRNVFITGHSGFKGSWLALWLEQLGATVTGYSLEPPTAPSHYNLLYPNRPVQPADVRDLAAVQAAVTACRPDIIFHLAAQPLVRVSYEQPAETFAANIMGTVNICEAARQCDTVRAVVCITTDKVYENNEWPWGYREVDRLGGHDPYSSSKAAAELTIASYRRSFFPPETYGKKHNVLLCSVRAGNVIGGGDWARDRLIPDIMKARAQGQKTVIRSPRSTRPWQHVLECLSGYLCAGQRLLEKDIACATAFNFGPPPEDELSVKAVCELVRINWPGADFEFPALADQPHEAGVLTLDSARARQVLGWQPVWNASRAVQCTVNWYRAFYEQKQITSTDDLEAFVSQARATGAVWA